MFRRLMAASIALLIGLMSACAVISPTPTEVPPVAGTPAESEWPTQGWRTARPEDQGMDPAALTRAVQRAQKMNLHSLLVIRGGVLVSETYFTGYDADKRHELYSVTKSFTATLFGIAVDQGYITTLDQPVLELFPNLQARNSDANKSAMTLAHLLTMTSGLDWAEGDAVYRAMYMSPDWVQYVLDIPMRGRPGSEFRYCSGCSHVLSAAIQKAVGINTKDFADANLFKPLGITNYAWDAGSQDIPIGGWGLQLTPRDMAKLGYLYLHKGNWDGRQIVSSAWVESASRVQIETGGGWGYGYQWWVDPAHRAYAARGRYGQLIYVVPDLNLIVVGTAAAESDEALIALIREEIIPAIKSE
jgi:CubicO group peptidase (beta-lactamase class C family)